ncbi:MAG: aldo/keto reductase [Proteobacteria bacterium]|nr:aldo/keto reductase [Pseudomonadota bacterium]
MKYRELGKTGEKVSVLGFGCMRLPILGGSDNPYDTLNPEKFIDEEKAGQMIRYAFDKGINYFDTAYRYHTGQSEVFLGRALRSIREKVLIASKLPVWMVESPDDFDRILDEQLNRLNTDYLDVYLLHGLSGKHWEKVRDLGVMDFLERARADGRIRHHGFSFHDRPEVFREIVDYAPWDVCLIQYNYLDVEFQAGRAGLEYASEKGIGVMVMEPLRGGKLAGRVPPAVLEEWAKTTTRRSPVQWAFLWLWDQPQVCMALSGMSSIDQLEENIRIAGEAGAGILREEDKDIIRRVREIYLSRSKVGCTGCGYCLPCPSGVNIPWNLSLYNNRFMFDEEELSAMIYNHIIPPGERAFNCVECGRCETLCPQKIPIMRELKNVEKTLGRKD